MKELFPIGSVVDLKNAEKSMMIIGLLQKKNNDELFDYLAVPFPEGFVDEDTLFLFNHDNICGIKFIGCVNAESQSLHKNIIDNYDKLVEKKKKEDKKNG